MAYHYATLGVMADSTCANAVYELGIALAHHDDIDLLEYDSEEFDEDDEQNKEILRRCEVVVNAVPGVNDIAGIFKRAMELGCAAARMAIAQPHLSLFVERAGERERRERNVRDVKDVRDVRDVRGTQRKGREGPRNVRRAKDD